MGYVSSRNAAVSEDAIRVARETVLGSLAPFGVEDIAVRPGTDHDGDPVLFIEAGYGANRQPMDGQAFLQMLVELQARLAAVGEDRFPHIVMRPIAAPTAGARAGSGRG